jgi:hypothetical protein
MRMRKLRGRKTDVDALRAVPDPHAAGQLADLEARFDAGAEVTPVTLRPPASRRKHPVKVLGEASSKKLTSRPRLQPRRKEKIETGPAS